MYEQNASFWSVLDDLLGHHAKGEVISISWKTLKKSLQAEERITFPDGEPPMTYIRNLLRGDTLSHQDTDDDALPDNFPWKVIDCTDTEITFRRVD